MQVKNVPADVVHCHDWQSAPVAWGGRAGAAAVFTIHNLNYGADLIGRAMAACDVATTVSPTYAREVGGMSGGGWRGMWAGARGQGRDMAACDAAATVSPT